MQQMTDEFDPISIHALTRSATRVRGGYAGHTGYFNPRTHEECDDDTEPIIEIDLDFNPRTHEECDGTSVSGYSRNTYFNPRTHEECD
ncbi:Hypothetical protein TR210_671 [Trichococcus ilyis]|uniref:Uncharacterized protein n=1 Tax=Trichococcus ilyis TaxID=640938 RepID=A0A143YDF9_9LACT|nr:Hypothetical protein TR210_671 [Trichococcus ilyis]